MYVLVYLATQADITATCELIVQRRCGSLDVSLPYGPSRLALTFLPTVFLRFLREEITQIKLAHGAFASRFSDEFFSVYSLSCHHYHHQQQSTKAVPTPIIAKHRMSA
jgi:hypothetical protein